MSRYDQACREILDEVKKRKARNQIDFNRIKLDVIRDLGIKKIPKNTDILNIASQGEREQLDFILTMKPIRTMAGVSVVAIMTKPIHCPHAKKGIGPCIYCPGGIKSAFGDVPQSYTGKEPTTRRAIRNNFDAYLQVFNRLEQYIVTNKVPDKVEIIVMGGTFPSFPKKYQDEFITLAYKAMNDFSRTFFKNGKLQLKKFLEFFELPGELNDIEREKKIHAKCLELKSRGNEKGKKKGISILEIEQKKNEKAKIRCVGLTIETKPDYGKLKQANQMLKLGCTRVEIGVQTIFDKILKKIKRGHTIKDTVESTQILKDLGLKINYQVMPGLPGVSRKEDFEALRGLFIFSEFRPDMLKIYPCMVLKGTKLYDMWKRKKYKPLTTQQAASLIAKFKENVPEYCRIMRVQRDIPTFMTEAGVDKTNLRQYIEKVMKYRKIRCRCIRCREIGRFKGRIGKPIIYNIHYRASKGTEFFIVAEYKDHILGFCRLRFPSGQLRDEITDDSSLIRELHVYGMAEPISGKTGKTARGEAGEKGKKASIEKITAQHKGIGKEMLKYAEQISRTYYKNKVVVISGIGAREYYKKAGYHKQGVYMVKKLRPIWKDWGK
ncbi:MAG: tRNA uridine(34) 5-carboxymethylaminomethyl modification radical SAM/GNAT enzyme Elp3 [Candidatus Woesearchaeota archaeon]